MNFCFNGNYPSLNSGSAHHHQTAYSSGTQHGASDNHFTLYQQNQNQYNDEFVLKCQFSALIPAFDPRPGKNNINQIQDISVPTSSLGGTSGVATEASVSQANDTSGQKALAGEARTPKVDLYLKVEYATVSAASENALEFVKEEIKLTNKNATIFQYIQNLIALNKSSKEQQQQSDNKKQVSSAVVNNNSMLHFEKMKSIWDVNYTLIYRESVESREGKFLFSRDLIIVLLIDY